MHKSLSTTQRRGNLSFSMKHLLTKHHPSMATFQPYGLGHHQPVLWPLTLLQGLPVASSVQFLRTPWTTPLHKNNSLPMQARWPRIGPIADLAAAHKVPPIHLDGSTKHFYSLQEIGRNQQNWALYSSRLVSTVGCFQGCRHRGIKEKKTTTVLHDPLSVYITFSFSAFARKY